MTRTTNRLILFCYGLLSLFLLSPKSLTATHIVGGEITYRCLGNDLYEISVVVFRDCDTGVPWFDNPAGVGVFDSNNNLIFDLRLFLRNNDTLDLDLTDPCLVAPPNVCIHTTTYRDTVTLPFRPGGYQIAYQRCCRNQDIVNIIDPLSTGATFSVTITEEALLACNSSPVFRDWPPVYICANAPIIYDHSAIDLDGDSIFYELCTPLTGATTNNPQPQPPFNPPYAPVSWLPPYGLGNMLGGTIQPLNIDPLTGLLTGVPENLGVFVVGVCAREYRNGVLLSTIRRDFQYAVGVCGRRVTSAFFAPEIQCDNSLAVQFVNNSQTLGLGFQWDFGDPMSNVGSTLANPGYVYADTGRYTVRLIADPGSLCADTTFRDIYLQYESILPAFDYSFQVCNDTVLLDFSDLSQDTISRIVAWQWDLGNGQTSTQASPRAVYRQSGQYLISLLVTAANGCQAQINRTLDLAVATQTSPDTVAVCEPGVGVVLNPGGDPNLIYQWSPATGLSSTTATSPLANPNSTTLYTVSITAINQGDTCRSVQQVLVLVGSALSVNLPADTATCANNLLLSASVTGGQAGAVLQYEWAYNSNFSPLFSQSVTTNVDLNNQPQRWVYLQVRDPYGCVALDSVLVRRQNTPILANFAWSRSACDSTVAVQFTDLSNDFSRGPIVSWSWQFGDGQTSNQQNPLHVYNRTGAFPVRLTITSAQGCVGEFRDTLIIRLARLAAGNAFGVCPGQSSVVLNPGGDPSLLYQWSPATGLSSTTVASPTASPAGPTTYTVTITAITGADTCQAVHQVSVSFPPPITVTVPPTTVYCGNTVTVQAQSNTAVSFLWAANPLFTNLIANGNPVTFTPQTSPQSMAYVRATDAFGCTATASTLIEQRFAPINVQFSYQSLGCADTLRMQFTDLTIDTLGSRIIAWEWLIFDGVQVQTSTQQNPLFILRRNANYFVSLTVRLANGCSGQQTVSFPVDLAALTHGNTLSLCGDSLLVLNPGGNPAAIYNWEPAPGLSSTTSPSPTAQPPSLPFTYRVTITANNPGLDTCISIQNITIVDSPRPFIDLPADTSFCSPSFMITAVVAGAFSSLEWSLDPNFSFIPVVNFNPVFVNFGSPDSLMIYARVRDNLGCVSTDSSRLRYLGLNIPVLADYSFLSCTDSLFVDFRDLTADTFPSPITQWTWSFYDGRTSNQQNPNLRFDDVQTWRPFSLQVRLRNGCQGTVTDSFNYRAARLYERDSLSLCAGGAVNLNVNGDPGLLYQWAPATGLSDPTVFNPQASPTVPTWYRVTITAPQANGDTCTHIDSVFVNPENFVLQAMPDTVLCGNRLVLRALTNRPFTSMDWSLNRQFSFLLGQGDSLPSNANISQWFYVRATDNQGCTAVDSVLVDVQRRPLVVDFRMDFLGCALSLDVQLVDITEDTLNNPIVAWQWTLGNGQTAQGPSVLANYATGGQYFITLRAEGRNGCFGLATRPLSLQLPSLVGLADTLNTCEGQAIRLNPQGGTSGAATWTPAQGLDNPNLANPLFLADSSRLYRLELRSNAVLDGDTSLCLLRDSVLVMVNRAPRQVLSYDSTACEPEFQISSSLLQSQGQATWLWSSSRNFSDSLSTDSLWTYSFAPGQDSLWLYWQLSDEGGCPIQDSLLLRFQGLSLSLPDSLFLCPEVETFGLLAQVAGDTSALSLVWSPQALSQNGLEAEFSRPSLSQAYGLLLSNAAGCEAQAQTWVEVFNSPPPLSIQASDTLIAAGQTVQLQATAGAGYQYSWAANPDLSNLNTANPQAIPSEALRVYSLSIRDAFGCRNSADIRIRWRGGVCEEPNIFVPNTFTPNGDGLNDILFVRGTAITELYFAVYNRWGERVFETNDIQRGWDGTFRGQTLNSDVYGYYLEARCAGGESFFKKGNVTLMR